MRIDNVHIALGRRVGRRSEEPTVLRILGLAENVAQMSIRQSPAVFGVSRHCDHLRATCRLNEVGAATTETRIALAAKEYTATCRPCPARRAKQGCLCMKRMS